MGSRTDYLYNAANGPLLDQLAGKHGTLHVQAFAVVDSPFQPGLFRFLARPIDLFQRGKCRFIRKIMLAMFHRPKPQLAALGRNAGRGDQLNLRIPQNLLLGRCHFRLRKGFDESLHLLRIRIIHRLQLGSGLD
ncbi:hypothetical protein D3C81_1028220 [compost metagenome]